MNPAICVVPLAPSDYEGVWFTPDELRIRNLELAKFGRRICKQHQGAALPLTEENFPYTQGKDWFRGMCRKCYQKNQNTGRRKRYMRRLDLRISKRKRNSDYYYSNRLRPAFTRLLGVSA